VDVVAHVREAARCGDAPVRDGLDPAAVPDPAADEKTLDARVDAIAAALVTAIAA